MSEPCPDKSSTLNRQSAFLLAQQHFRGSAHSLHVSSLPSPIASKGSHLYANIMHDPGANGTRNFGLGVKSETLLAP